jgi:hypothetical protein
VRADVRRHVWGSAEEEQTGRRRSIRVRLLPTGDGKTRHRDHDLAHRILGIVTMTKMKMVVG